MSPFIIILEFSSEKIIRTKMVSDLVFYKSKFATKMYNRNPDIVGSIKNRKNSLQLDRSKHTELYL